MNRTKLIRSAFLMWGFATSLLFTASTALAVCPSEGNCCEANGSPGCEDEECCELICAKDPFCCDVEWDAACADAAQEPCCSDHPCVFFEDGDCCQPNDTPGCMHAPCCKLICDKLPHCCNEHWDDACAAAANEHCDLCQAESCPGEGDCCVPLDTPGCEDEECCELICAKDPFCCDVMWDEICAFNAQETCTCGDSFCVFFDEGDCCQPNDTPGCNHFPCCKTICPIDPFCCEVEWDQFCANLAFKHCTVCSIPGDLNNDGVVDGEDLLILLSAWGACNDCDDCPADLNGDCTVDGKDLLILLSNWG